MGYLFSGCYKNLCLKEERRRMKSTGDSLEGSKFPSLFWKYNIDNFQRKYDIDYFQRKYDIDYFQRGIFANIFKERWKAEETVLKDVSFRKEMLLFQRKIFGKMIFSKKHARLMLSASDNNTIQITTLTLFVYHQSNKSGGESLEWSELQKKYRKAVWWCASLSAVFVYWLDSFELVYLGFWVDWIDLVYLIDWLN